MARRRYEEETENQDRWLISYADFITLLFGFFVVMYAVSSVNEGKYRVVSESLEAAFRAPTMSMRPFQVGRPAHTLHRDTRMNQEILVASRPSPIPLPIEAVQLPDPRFVPVTRPEEPDACVLPVPAVSPLNEALTAEQCAPTTPRDEPWQFPEEPERLVSEQTADIETQDVIEAPELADVDAVEKTPSTTNDEATTITDDDQLSETAEIADQLRNALPELVEAGAVTVRFTPQAAEIEIGSGLLFDSASAGLDGAAMPILAQVANALRPLENDIRVEGFTDNRPIETQVYPSNWELSAARAASVVHYFSRLGIQPRRMAAVGYGEHRPIDTNSSTEGRKRNRRVLILVLAQANPELAELSSPSLVSAAER